MTISNIIFFGKAKKKKCYTKNTYEVDISIYESTYKTPLLTLALCGLRLTHVDSPASAKLWAFLYWFGVFNLLTGAILELIYMVQVGEGGTFDDAVEIFRMLPCIGYLAMAQIKTYKIFVYRPVFESLINDLRGMWPRGAVTKEECDLITKPIKRLNFVNRGLLWCNHLLLGFFIFPHALDVVRRWMGHSVDLKLPFYYWLPFDPQMNVVYEVLLVLQSWQALITVWLILCCDLLFYVFMNHITTQFELLAIKITKMIYVPPDSQLIPEYPLAHDSKVYLIKNRENIILNGTADWERKHLKELNVIILKHQDLIRLSVDVESMFSFQMLINFIYSSVIICFCGFCVVIVEKWNEFIYKTFLATTLTQAWLFCWYGQRLIDSSAGIGHALYKSGWYLLSKRVRSTVIIMIHRAQKHVRITTYGFSVISLTSYTTIIKTAWSYFTLLLNAYKK